VPDLILLDIAMPQMDGWTVAAPSARGLAHLPILLVSANAFENLHERNEPPLVNDFWSSRSRTTNCSPRSGSTCNWTG
jgi:CheY-like chemotaxis protein